MKKQYQCEAMTRASTYSAAHRCLKRAAAQKIGKLRLCVHHQNMTAPEPARLLLRA